MCHHTVIFGAPSIYHLSPDQVILSNSFQDLLNLIDLCPFLASDRIKYNDKKVLALLQRNPRAACLRAPFHRFGIGTDLHPLALVVALGGSLDVVKIMVKACPDALAERLSGRRTLLHYVLSEGVDFKVSAYTVLRSLKFAIEMLSHPKVATLICKLGRGISSI